MQTAGGGRGRRKEEYREKITDDEREGGEEAREMIKGESQMEKRKDGWREEKCEGKSNTEKIRRRKD